MFETTREVRKECILSPLLPFSLIMDEAIKEARKKGKPYDIGYWKMQTIKIVEICYADDMILIAKDEKALNKNLKVGRARYKKYEN